MYHGNLKRRTLQDQDDYSYIVEDDSMNQNSKNSNSKNLYDDDNDNLIDKSGKEDDDVEVIKAVDEKKKIKKSISRKFINNILFKKNGLPMLYNELKNIKYKKGHEIKVLQNIIYKYRDWGFQLFPILNFNDFIEKMSSLSGKKDVANFVHSMETYSAGGLDMNLLVDNTYGNGDIADSYEDDSAINQINNDKENDLPDIDLYDNALSDYSNNNDDADYYNNLNYDQEEESAPPPPPPKVVAPSPPVASLPPVNNNVNATAQKRQKFNPKDMIGLLQPKTKFIPPTNAVKPVSVSTEAAADSDN